jgi:hypothetical protein
MLFPRVDSRRKLRAIVSGPTVDREAVAQILAYMGDLMCTGKPVRGILVAGDFPARTIAAARAVPILQLRKYGFQFSFEAIGSGVTETVPA